MHLTAPRRAKIIAAASVPGFPANYLGQLDPWTGQISAVTLTGPTFNPQGLLFLSGHGFGHQRHGRSKH